MPPLNINHKLLPAKKVWKRFASTLHKKLRKLGKSKAINKTTKTLSTVFRLKRKTLFRPSSALLIHRRKHQLRPGFAPVFVDDLFMVQMTNTVENYKARESTTIAAGSSNADKTETRILNRSNLYGSSNGNKMDASNKVTHEGFIMRGSSSSTPQRLMRCVDERAEEFISKFKEEMRLQRQSSSGEFQEMLARSA